MVLEKELYRIERKRMKEQQVVGKMIGLYCRRHGHTAADGELCAECQQMGDYAKARIKHCPFMDRKSFCANCKVHCYKPEMQERIRKVMRYTGPRMLLYHPLMVIRHLVSSMIEKHK